MRKALILYFLCFLESILWKNFFWSHWEQLYQFLDTDNTRSLVLLLLSTAALFVNPAKSVYGTAEQSTFSRKLEPSAASGGWKQKTKKQKQRAK